MAIKLRVQENKTTFKVNTDSPLSFTVEQGIPIYPVPYSREYTVTPSAETQVLETEGLMMAHNVTINPIPSNYGLITWNGSTLTVS
jgi:hypothetical protein